VELQMISFGVNKRITYAVFLLSLLFLFISAPNAKAAAVCREHPCVFMNAADVAALKQTIKDWDYAKQYFDELKAATDAFRARGLDVPALGGIYTQKYICPIHGKYLRFDPDQPHKHFCDLCNKYYESAELDGCWREFKHNINFDFALNASLIYQITGDSSYASWARQTLLYYADNYKKYPPHGGPAGLGRLTSQSLDEAVLLINAAAAYDLIADSPVMSYADRDAVTRKFLVPAARHVEGYPFGIHNIQVWQSTAMLVSGLLAGNSELTDRATATLRDEIDKGITPEGLWFETSVGYHIYAMKPFSVLAVVCRNQQLNVCDNPKFRKIFTVLPEITMPNNFALPPINDYRHNVNLAEMLPGAVAARYAFGDEYLDSLIYVLLGKNQSIWTFMYLRRPVSNSKSPEWTPPVKSSHLPGSGLTVLRRDGMYALIKYNRSQGGHDHNDRLEVLFNPGDGELYPDLGTVPYGHPLYRAYYRRTEAHNTIMVDGQQQYPSACDPLFFCDESDFTGVTVECKEIYDGVTVRRTLALTGDSLIDVTVVSSSADHTYDWFLHINSKDDKNWAAFPAKSPIDAVSPNPEIVLRSQTTPKNGDTIFFQPASQSIPMDNITFYSSAPSSMYKGFATGYAPDEKMPFIMWRQEGKAAVFAAITSRGAKYNPKSTFTDKKMTIETPAGRKIVISFSDGKIIEK
jgi:hypothetical protein